MKKLLCLIVLFVALSSIAFSQTKSQDKGTSPYSSSFSDTSKSNPFSNMGSVFQSMGPMYKTMLSSMMEGLLDYYEKPGTIERIAAVNHKYFEALKSAGFTDEQAMKIITTSPIGSSMPSAK